MRAASHRKVKSAERLLALFELFSREQKGFAVGFIANKLNMPQPSVSMLLHNLKDLGYLEYNPSARTFFPSIRVALLGSWIDRRFSEYGSVASHLDELHRKLGFTVFIGIQNGPLAQYVLAQHAEAPDRLDVTSGQYRSLTGSAMGRALLARMPDEEALRWVRRCNAEASHERELVRESDYLALLRKFREQGYAETCGDVTPGLGAVAMTFNSPMGNTPLAVGAGGPSDLVRERLGTVIEELHRFRSVFEKNH